MDAFGWTPAGSRAGCPAARPSPGSASGADARRRPRHARSPNFCGVSFEPDRNLLWPRLNVSDSDTQHGPATGTLFLARYLVFSSDGFGTAYLLSRSSPESLRAQV